MLFQGPRNRGSRGGHSPPLFSDINFSVGKMYDAEQRCISDISTTRSNDFT